MCRSPCEEEDRGFGVRYASDVCLRQGRGPDCVFGNPGVVLVGCEGVRLSIYHLGGLVWFGLSLLLLGTGEEL